MTLLLFFFGLLGLTSVQAQVSGRVFRDFTANGVQDVPISSTAISVGEPGVAGVVVTAFPATGAPVSVTTTVAGTYTFTAGQLPSGTAVRLELGALPTADFSGPVSTAAASSGSPVQFVTAGSSTTANFGINYPADYCGTINPLVYTTCFVQNLAPTGTGNDVLVGVNYNATTPVAHLAIAGQVGSVWGVAYERNTNKIYTSAFVKRHVGLATAGGPAAERTGAIYVTTPNATSGTTSLFVSLDALGFDTGTDPHGPLPTTPNQPSYDVQSFTAVGKVGLGGIDLSDDGQFLYTVNLFNRTLYRIPTTAPSAANVVAYPIPNPCTNALDYRPFAVKVYRGSVYVGVICSSESNQSRTTLGQASNTQLTATVYQLTGTTFTPVLSFGLSNFRRGVVGNEGAATASDRWYPWLPSTDPTLWLAGSANQYALPQPILSDIEFDVNGDMLVGLMDRFGHQTGYQNYFPDPAQTNTTLIRSWANGDQLRARRCGGASTFTLESNASLCGSAATAGAGNNQGPGGGEWYYQDDALGGFHQETSNGGLAQLPGSGELTVSAMDPTNNAFSGGIRWYSNTAGTLNRGFQLYDANTPGAFGKASGIGDAEFGCAPAPVQIGNRVWRDNNDNGTQDPAEIGIGGLTVTLRGPGLGAGGVSVTTTPSGQYYFTNAVGTNATGFAYGLTLTPGGSYTLSFPTSTSAGALTLSSKPNSAADNIDTDADAAGRIAFSLGQAGQNDFSFDVGFAPCIPPSVTATASANAVCVGQPVTLSTVVSAGGSFTVNAPAGVTLSSTTATTISASNLPTGVNTFTVTASNSPTCFTTTTVSVSVSAASLISLSASQSAICVGQPVTLNVLGIPAGGLLSLGPLGPGGTILNPITTATGVFSPTATTTFLASVSVPIPIIGGFNIFNSCPVTVTVNQPPVLPPLGLSVCVGTNLSLSALTGPTGSLSALSGLGNVFRVGNLLTGGILTTPVAITAGVNLFNVTSTNPLGCTTNAPVSVTGTPGPVLPPLGLSICVGTNLDLSTLTGPGGSLSALSGLGNVFRVGNLLTGGILTSPVAITAGVNLFNVTSTNPLGCTTNAPVSVTGTPGPVLPPLGLSICVGTNLDLSTLTGPGGSLSALSGLGNVFRVGNLLTGGILTTPVAITAGVNLFNVTSTNPLGCTTNAPVSVTGTPGPVLPPLGLSICVGTNLDLSTLTGPGGSLSALSGLGNVFRVGNLLTGGILTTPVAITAGVNLFNVTSTNPLGCTTNAPVSVTGTPGPVLPPLGLSICVGTNLDLSTLTGPTGSLSALSGLGNVFRVGNLLTGGILTTPVAITAGVNLFNVTSTNPLGCTTNAPVSVTGTPGPTLPPLGLSICVGTNLDLSTLTGPTGSLSALSGLGNVFRVGNLLTGGILTTPVAITAGVNLFNVTSTNPLGCTTNAPVSVTGTPGPTLPPLGLSICVGTNLDLSTLTGPTGSLSALSGLGNVFRVGNLLTGGILTTPVAITAGVNLFNVTSTNPLGCTTNAPVSVTGTPGPVLPPLGLSICVGTNLDLSTLTGPTGSLSALSGLGNVFRVGNLLTGGILTTPVAITAGVNLFNVTSTNPLGCTTNAPVSVTGTPGPTLPPLGLSICVGTNLDLSTLTGPTGSLSALSGLGNVFRVGNLLTGGILTTPVAITAGVNLFNVTSTNPLGCTTNAPVSVTGTPGPTLPPLGLSICVGTNLDLSTLTGPGGSLSALSGLGNVFRVGNLLTGGILTSPVAITAGVNLFNVTSTNPLGCTTNAPVSVTGTPGPVLPPLGLSICVGTNLDLSTLTGPGGSLSALSGLGNVFRVGNLLTGGILTTPVAITAGVNLFNVTSTNPLGCTTNAPVSVTGTPGPVLPPLGLSICVGTNLDLSTLTGPTGSLSALSGLGNVFRVGNLLTGGILTTPVAITAGVNLFNVTSTNPLGCTTNAPVSVTGTPGPTLPPLGLSICVGTNLDLSTLTGPTGSLSALSGLGNVFRVGNLLTGGILTTPVAITAGVNLFNVTSTNPLGCTTNAPVSVTGTPGPTLPPLGLSICVGTNLDLSTLTGPTGSLSALSGLGNVFRVGNLLTGGILTTPVAITAGVNLFNVTSTNPLGCTTNAPVSVTGTPGPTLPPLGLSICVGTNLDLSTLTGPTGSLSALSGLGNVFRVGNLLTGGILTTPVAITAGVNLFNVTSTNPLGCTTNAPVSVTGTPGPVLPPLGLSICVGTNLDLPTLTGPTGSLSALSGLGNVFRVGNLLTGGILTTPVAITAGVNLFNVTSTNPLGCTTNAPVSVTGTPGPVLPPLGLSICVGTNLDLSTLTGPTGSLSALSGLGNVFRVGNLLTGGILTTPVAITAGVNLFNVTSTNPLGCTTNAPVSVTGTPGPVLPPLGLSICVGTNLDLASLIGPTGSLSALNGLTNVFGVGGVLGGAILTSPVAITAGVNLFNVTSTNPLGCTTNAPVSVTGTPGPTLPPLGLSICVGTNLDLASLIGPTGSLSALNGLTNVFGVGGVLGGAILTTPVAITAGVNLFNVTSTNPLGCTTNAPVSVTGTPGPVLPPLGLSICVGTNLDLSTLTGPTGSLSALSGLGNVFRVGNLLTGGILTTPVAITAGVNLFNVTSTNPLGCTTNAPVSVTGTPGPVLPPLGLSICVGTNLDLSTLTGPTGSLSALSGLGNVFRVGNLLTGGILTTPVAITAGVNLFNVTSTNPLGCTTNAPVSVTGTPGPVLPPLGLSICVGTNLDLSTLTGPTGSLSALSGLGNVFRVGNLLTGGILTTPVAITAGVNLFNVTSTNPLGCTTNAPVSVTGTPGPVLPPLGLSICVGTNLDLSTLTGPTGSLSALSGLGNVFRVGNLLTGGILTTPVAITAGVNLFNVTSTNPLGCTTNAPVSVTGTPGPVLPPLGLSICVGTNLDLSTLTGPTGSLSALSGLGNVFRVGNLLTGGILTTPVAITAGVNLFNVTSTNPLGCTTNAPVSVTGTPGPTLPPLGLSICVGTNLDLASLIGPTGSLSALNGLTNVFGVGGVLGGAILTSPVAITAGVNLFNVTSTNPLGCTTNAPVSVTGTPGPTLPPLGLSICVGTNLDLASLIGPTGSLSALNGLTNVFGVGGVLGGAILTTPVAITAGVNLFNVTSTNPLGCTTNAPVSVTGTPGPVLPPLGLSICVGTNLDLSTLTGPTGSLSALSGLGNVFRVGNLLTGGILTTPVAITAGVNLFNVTSTNPLGCTTNAPVSVTGTPGPTLPPLGLSICVGTNLDLSTLTGPTGSLSALSGLGNVFRVGNLLTGGILTTPVAITAGVNLFNVTSTNPLGCTTNAPVSVTGTPGPVLPPLGLSICVGTNLDLSTLTGPTGSLSALSGLGNVFRVGNLLTGGILTTPVAITAGVNLFNVTSTNPLGCTTNAPVSVTGTPGPVLPPLGLSICVGTNLDLSTLTGPTGSLSALSGLGNVFRVGNLLTGGILTTPVAITAGVNLFNVTSTNPLGCTTNAPVSVTGTPGPVLPPISLSLCVGATVDLTSLSGLAGLDNVFRTGDILGLGTLIGSPTSVSVGVGLNLFNVVSTSPTGCSVATPISITGVNGPALTPISLSVCVGATVDLTSLSGLAGLDNVFRTGDVLGLGTILATPISVSIGAGVNLFNVTSTSSTGCSAATSISVIGVDAPALVPISMSLCIGGTLDLVALLGTQNVLTGLTTNFFANGLPITTPTALTISPGESLFSVVTTNAIGCSATTPISITGILGPMLTPISLSACIQATLDLTDLPELAGLSNVFRLGDVLGQGTLVSNPLAVSIGAGVNLFNVASTNPMGCSAATPITVTGVDAPVLPPVSVSICATIGTPVNLNAILSSVVSVSGLTNVFRLGDITGSVIADPTAVSLTAGVNLFTVVSSNPTGCSATTPLSITLTVKPVVSITAALQSQTICEGTTPLPIVAVVVSGTVTDSQFFGPLADTTSALGVSIGAGLTLTPTGSQLPAPGQTAFFALLVNGSSGCQDTVFVSVTTTPRPIAAATSVSICLGESVNLAAQLTTSAGNLSAFFATRLDAEAQVSPLTSLTVTPALTTTFFTRVTLPLTACFRIDSIVVTVLPKPNAGTDQTLVCTGTSPITITSLTATPAGGTFSNLPGNPTIAAFTPNGISTTVSNLTVGTYSFVYSLSGCQDTVNVTVQPCPELLGSIGDFVFSDIDRDGRQDPAEPGVNGVTVRLLQETTPGNFTVISTTLTAGNGNYLFPNLPAGTYVVEFVATNLPTGFLLSPNPNAPGVPDNLDSDADPVTGRTAPIVIVPTDPAQRDILTVDAGLVTDCPPAVCVPFVIRKVR